MPFWRYGLAPPPRTSPRVLVSCGAGAAAGQLGDHGLVQHGLVDRRREERLGQVDRAGLRAGLGVEGRGGHRSGLPDEDERVAARRGRGPDQEQVALGVGARRWSAFLTVTRALPMWPAMRVPLNTLPGVVPPPIEPGARCESEPWVSGPRRKWWRLTVPEKPLPLLTPMTSTMSPSANMRHVQRLADLVLGQVVDAELARVADARQVLELAEARLGRACGRCRRRAARPCSRRAPAVRSSGHRIGLDGTPRRPARSCRPRRRPGSSRPCGRADRSRHGCIYILISMSTPAGKLRVASGRRPSSTRDPGCR